MYGQCRPVPPFMTNEGKEVRGVLLLLCRSCCCSAACLLLSCLLALTWCLCMMTLSLALSRSLRSPPVMTCMRVAGHVRMIHHQCRPSHQIRQTRLHHLIKWIVVVQGLCLSAHVRLWRCCLGWALRLVWGLGGEEVVEVEVVRRGSQRRVVQRRRQR